MPSVQARPFFPVAGRTIAKTALCAAPLVVGTGAHAADPAVEALEPPFWWAEMKHPELQIMVRGESVSEFDAHLDCPGVRLVGTHRVDSPNYH